MFCISLNKLFEVLYLLYTTKHVILCFQGLLDIDAVETGHIVQRHFALLIPQIIPHLSDKQLFLFLKGIM